MKKTTECSFLTQGKVSKTNLQPQPTANQLLAEFVLISTVSYHLSTMLS